MIDALNHFATKYIRNGFKKLYLRIRNAGYDWNHKRVYRVYKSLGLNMRPKSEVREKVKEWKYDYNHHRPHEALENLSPIKYLQKHNQDKKLSA